MINTGFNYKKNNGTNTEFIPSVIDIFGDIFGAGAEVRKHPPVNIAKDDNTYFVELSVPGFGKEDINVNVEDNKLIVSGEKKKEESETTKNYTRREFSAEKFERTFSLPENVNADEIKAEFRNGILFIAIPKKVEEKKTKQIIVE